MHNYFSFVQACACQVYIKQTGVLCTNMRMAELENENV